MTIKIIRIEEQVVTCELDNGGIIDIGRRWFSNNIEEGQVIEFEHKKDS